MSSDFLKKKKKKVTHLLQIFVMLFFREEVNIPGGDDAHQFAAHFSSLCDRNARETVSYFGLKHIPDCVTWAHYDGVCDKTLLKPLQTRRIRTKWLGLMHSSMLSVRLFSAAKATESQTPHSREKQKKQHTQLKTTQKQTHKIITMCYTKRQKWDKMRKSTMNSQKWHQDCWRSALHFIFIRTRVHDLLKWEQPHKKNNSTTESFSAFGALWLIWLLKNHNNIGSDKGLAEPLRTGFPTSGIK